MCVSVSIHVVIVYAYAYVFICGYVCKSVGILFSVSNLYGVEVVGDWLCELTCFHYWETEAVRSLAADVIRIVYAHMCDMYCL